MELVINSPLQPTLFKQKIRSNKNVLGNLSIAKPFGFLLGRNSFKAKVDKCVVCVIEQKKEYKRRNWKVFVQDKHSKLERAGEIIMVSNTKETLSANATFYTATFQNLCFEITKPYMQLGKHESYLYDGHQQRIASVVTSHTKKPRFKKTVYIHEDKMFSAGELAFFVVVLNMTLFES